MRTCFNVARRSASQLTDLFGFSAEIPRKQVTARFVVEIENGFLYQSFHELPVSAKEHEDGPRR